jgi:lysophospholipase L1-like esterase
VILYNLGITLYNDDNSEARRYLDRAKLLDHYSLRIKEPYNDAMRKFAGDHQCRLVELDSLLQGLPENRYFVDHCHPTVEGHKLIAGKLFERIVPLLGAGD